MLLSPSQLRTFLTDLRGAVPAPVYLCGADWTLLAATERTADLDEALSACRADGGCRGAGNAADARPYRFRNRLLGYVLISPPGPHAQAAFPYIFTLLDLLLEGAPSPGPRRLSDARTQLANQLAFYGKTNWESVSFMKLLQYAFDIPRCAVLFHLPSPQSCAPSSLQEAFPSLLPASPRFSGQDIYGPVSQDKFLVFKNVSGASMREKLEYAAQYALGLLRLLDSIYHAGASAYIGSPYPQLEKLHNSFSEAQFLLNNAQFLSGGAPVCLSIDQYLVQYLATLLPPQYKAILFKDHDLALGRSKAMQQTLRAITTSNNNLTRAAEKLHIHRNTMLQRFDRLRETLSVNPLHNDTDRLSLHCYSLYKSQTVTWHACINIHPWNIQHRGLLRFAELLRQKSGGAMRLDIDTISTAGDYRQLFESVCSGALDCVSVNTGPLFDALKGWPHILELPFLFDSSREAEHLLNSFVKGEMFPALHAMGAYLAGFWSMGWRYITSRDPVRVPADLKGKRIRVMFLTKLVDDYFRSMGAVPIKAHYSDVPEAMAAGVVNCQENPYSNILRMEFFRTQTYILELNAFYDVNAVLFSKSAWERLPGELREVALSAFRETGRWLFSEAGRVNLEAREELLLKGMRILRPTPEEAGLWKEAAVGVYASARGHILLQGLLQKKGGPL